ncbi:hypothetical protein ACOMHN_032333 [Nucella lapillus]
MLVLEESSTAGPITAALSAGNTTSAGFDIPEGCVLKQVTGVIPEYSQQTLVSKQVNIIIDMFLLGICLPLCFAVSFGTNIINMAVFYKQGLKERINMCLFTLSLLDLLYVAVSYSVKSSVSYMFAIGKETEIGISNAFFLKTGLVGLVGIGTASQVASTTIALERCLCITRPLLVKTLMSTKKTACLLWSLVLVVVAMGILTGGMRLTVICVFDARDNSTFLQFYPKQFYVENKQVIHILGGIVFGTLLPALCVTCVAVCTVTIVVKMKKLSVWRETVSSASDSLTSRDLAVTRMIDATSVLFVVCIVPSITVRVAANLFPEVRPGGRYENLYFVLDTLYFSTSVINSSFNFFLYYLHGSKFREKFQQLFCACCKKTRSGLKSSD